MTTMVTSAVVLPPVLVVVIVYVAEARPPWGFH